MKLVLIFSVLIASVRCLKEWNADEVSAAFLILPSSAEDDQDNFKINNPAGNLSSTSSWSSDIHVSPDPLGSMMYGKVSISIYGHSDNDQLDEASKRYYFSPLCRVKPSIEGNILHYDNKTEDLSLVVELWNEELVDQVATRASELVGQPVKKGQVGILPFDKVTLYANSPPADSVIKDMVKDEWVDNEFNKKKIVSFPLLCDWRGEQFAERMRPEGMNGWTLLFSTSSTLLNRKSATLSAENITNVLLQPDYVDYLFQRFPRPTELLVRDYWKDELLKDLSSNLFSSSLIPFDLVSSDSVKLIRTVMETILVVSDVTIINESNKHLWELVSDYNEEDNDRPDRVANMYNRVYEKLNEEQKDQFIAGYRKVNISRVREVDQSNDVSPLFVRKNCSSANSSTNGLCNPEDEEKILVNDFGPNDFNVALLSLMWNGEMFTFEDSYYSIIRSPQLITQSFASAVNLTIWYATILFSSSLHV